ncbi:hypothetical protein IMSAGC014_00571 [Bacteroidaceae bacterium]|nr:hypothetical protein IMSAGC014_00571 [Bacteroidaceae bacterium]
MNNQILIHFFTLLVSFYIEKLREVVIEASYKYLKMLCTVDVVVFATSSGVVA